MHMKKQDGFTLLEMLISMAVAMIVLAAIYAAVNLGQKTTASTERKVYAQQDARAALEIMSIEIQMASYNPRPDLVTGTFWKTSNCTDAYSTEQKYKGIQSATPFSITVEMNLNGSNNIGDSANEIITYAYDASNQRITRSVNCQTPESFLGDFSYMTRAVRVINTNDVPIFRYFNAQGQEITGADLPAAIPDIARIDITLWVETENIDMNTGQRKKLFYSTSIIPRNHVITK